MICAPLLPGKNLINNFICHMLMFLVFQGIVGEKVCQFRGFMQQDAQEFMAFLLDGLHEVGLKLIGDYHYNSRPHEHG